ncbi:MAG TPA: response regulator [Terracidiphilus sp.]|jgi:DNA-binding NtrC family response regulator
MRTILLVEEDPLQAFVRMSVLEKRFPGVRRVADPGEALCLIEQPVFSDNLGLVIAGHRLSGLDGPAFVAELHARKPALPVLVLGDRQESASAYAGKDVRFLAKPIAADEMVAAASQLLDENEHQTH